MIARSVVASTEQTNTQAREEDVEFKGMFGYCYCVQILTSTSFDILFSSLLLPAGIRSSPYMSCRKSHTHMYVHAISLHPHEYHILHVHSHCGSTRK